jgi:hypothetical protein
MKTWHDEGRAGVPGLERIAGRMRSGLQNHGLEKSNMTSTLINQESEASNAELEAIGRLLFSTH